MRFEKRAVAFNDELGARELEGFEAIGKIARSIKIYNDKFSASFAFQRIARAERVESERSLVADMRLALVGVNDLTLYGQRKRESVSFCYFGDYAGWLADCSDVRNVRDGYFVEKFQKNLPL